MSALVLALLSFLAMLVGAIATLRPAHRASGIVAGIGALGCAAVLARSEAQRALRPSTWLLIVAVVVVVLAQRLRVERAHLSREQSEVR